MLTSSYQPTDQAKLPIPTLARASQRLSHCRFRSAEIASTDGRGSSCARRLQLRGRALCPAARTRHLLHLPLPPLPEAYGQPIQHDPRAAVGVPRRRRGRACGGHPDLGVRRPVHILVLRRLQQPDLERTNGQAGPRSSRRHLGRHVLGSAGRTVLDDKRPTLGRRRGHPQLSETADRSRSHACGLERSDLRVRLSHRDLGAFREPPQLPLLALN